MNIFQIDARIEQLNAEIKLLQHKRIKMQHLCAHEYGSKQWLGPASYDDKGGYFKACLKCKNVKLEED